MCRTGCKLIHDGTRKWFHPSDKQTPFNPTKPGPQHRFLGNIPPQHHVAWTVYITLTHWGRGTHICVSKLTIIVQVMACRLAWISLSLAQNRLLTSRMLTSCIRFYSWTRVLLHCRSLSIFQYKITCLFYEILRVKNLTSTIYHTKYRNASGPFTNMD